MNVTDTLMTFKGELTHLGGLDIKDPANHDTLCQPHLILVPNSILAQAVTAGRAFMPKGSFDILQYSGGKYAGDFWEPTGALHASQFWKPGKKHHIIIFATHNVSLFCSNCFTGHH